MYGRLAYELEKYGSTGSTVLAGMEGTEGEPDSRESRERAVPYIASHVGWRGTLGGEWAMYCRAVKSSKLGK
jgi:hypothetical protein